MSPRRLRLLHRGKIEVYDFYSPDNNNLYEKFKRLNPKEELIKRAKETVGETTNILEAGFILPDGTMLKLDGARGHCDVKRAVIGFDEYEDCSARGFVVYCFFMWYTNSIRVIVDPKTVLAQVWLGQEINDVQWAKLDFIISLLDYPTFGFDLTEDTHRGGCRFASRVKKARNSSSLRAVYERTRKEFKGWKAKKTLR